MKKIYFLLIALLFSATMAFAEDVAVSVHVSTPGTLAQEIINAGSRAAVVTKLTVTGTLNEEDYRTMRETAMLLYDIDLSGVTDTEMPYSAFSGKSALKSIVLPESLTSIGDGAFEYCESLTSITIPNSVTSIGNNAFWSNRISHVYISDISAWCNIVFYGTQSNPLNWAGASLYLNNEKVTDLIIPNSVTHIGDYTFCNCSSLTSITIPNSVTSIGDYAFNYCDALTSITIPNSVTSIGVNAFYGCPLTDITCYAGVPPTCGSNVFSSDVYSSATLTVPAVSKNDYLITSPWDAFINIETMDVTYYKLSLTSSDENMGRVTETKKYYTSNEVVEIWAEAYNGYKFTGWSDGNTDNPRTITMTGDLTLTAQWIEYTPTIAEVITMENETETTVKGTVSYVSGGNFWIQDATGGILCYCSNNGLVEGELVTLSGVKTIYHGSPELTNVTVVAKEVGKEVNAQIVTLSDILADSVNGYATYLCEMVYIEGVTISGYKGDYKDPYITDGFNEIQLYNWKDFTEDKYPVGTKVSLKAVLSIYNTTLQLRGKAEWLETFKHTISIFCDEEQGYVQGEGEYFEGTMATIAAIAYPGYEFLRWSDGNTENPRTFTVTEDVTLTANFAVRPYEVTLTCDETQGTVSGGGEYEPGSQVTITATAKEGYQFSYWRIYYNEWDYNTVYENPYTFEMGSQFYDIEAIFEEIPSYNVNVSSSNENWGTVKGGGIYVEYDTAVVIATPNEGYVFDYWYDSYYGNNYYGDTLQLEVHRTYNLTAYFRIAPTLVDGIYYYLDKEDFSAEVARSDDYTGDIVLPETVTHNRTIYDVTGIEQNAFAGTSITSLVVPNNIRSSVWLYECFDLKVLKAHADFISDIDGLYDTNIEEVYYTGGYVEYVRRISSLKVIDLSVTENTELERSLFREDADGNYEGFYNLRKLVLPNGLIKIHDRQFESLWLLEEVVIPEGVTEIPDGAFYDCHALSKVTLSKNLTSIGNYAFYSCHALENIVIPEGVTEIGNAAFYACSYLENIELPSTLNEIGNNAFAICSKVKSIKVKAHTPPTLWAKTFYNVDRNIPVYVAEVAYDDYVADQYWGEFFNIIATPEYNEDPTDVENTDETSVVIYTQGGMLYIEGVEADYNIFDASGRLIYNGRDAVVSLPRGVYMLSVGDKTYKVAM